MGFDEIYVHNSNLKIIGLIECAESVIWTSRYFECGDFEIYTHASKELLNLCKKGMFLSHKDSDMIGLLEEYKITTNLDGIDYMTISGRCATGLLSRRIVAQLAPNVQTYATTEIVRLMNNNIIYPGIEATAEDRKMSIFDGVKISLTSSGVVYTNEVHAGDTVYKAVTDICKNVGYGIKTVFNSTRTKLVPTIYQGKNKSRKQTTNTPVIFSPAYDNLAESEQLVSWANYANSGFLMSGAAEEKALYYYGLASGINRYEMFINASDIPAQSKSGLGVGAYETVLETRYQEQLANHKFNVSFSGKATSVETFEYKKDYNLGDIVTVENNYGASETARIVEIIETYDMDGYTITPVFKGETEQLT